MQMGIPNAYSLNRPNTITLIGWTEPLWLVSKMANEDIAVQLELDMKSLSPNDPLSILGALLQGLN